MFAKKQINTKTKENNTKNKNDENSSNKEKKHGILINSEILDKLLI